VVANLQKKQIMTWLLKKKLFHAYISWLLKSSSGAQVPLWATKIVTEK